MVDLEAMVYVLAERQSGQNLSTLSPFSRGPHLKKARSELEAIGISTILAEREALLNRLCLAETVCEMAMQGLSRTECGSCDYGLPQTCTCNPLDDALDAWCVAQEQGRES